MEMLLKQKVLAGHFIWGEMFNGVMLRRGGHLTFQRCRAERQSLLGSGDGHDLLRLHVAVERMPGRQRGGC